jgi:hypothetical protein
LSIDQFIFDIDGAVSGPRALRRNIAHEVPRDVPFNVSWPLSCGKLPT